MGANPDYTIFFHEKSIVYYLIDESYDDTQPSDYPERVSSLSELPNPYKAAEILLDKQGKVIAVAFPVGNTRFTKTTEGNIEVASIKNLPKRFF